MRNSFHRDAPLPYLLVEPESTSSAPDDLPLVVCLHGRGSNAEDLAGLAPELDRDRYRFAVPNAPLAVSFGMWGQGFAWYEMGATQKQGIALALGAIEEFVASLERRFGTSRGRMALMGFSQGAVMSLEVGLRSEEPFAAIVALSGYVVPDDTMRTLLAERVDRRILMVHGTEDQVIWVQSARQSVEWLRESGLDPLYKEFTMGHEVTPDEIALIRRFLSESFATTQ